MTQELDWDEIRRSAFADCYTPNHWPKDVKPISSNGTALLGVSEDSERLYWDGKLLQIKRRLSLTRFQTLIAFAGALGAFLAGLHPWVLFLGYRGWN